MNLIFYHFNCSERLLKSHHVSLIPVVAGCSQLLSKSIPKLFENVESLNSLLRHFKIQTLLKINCSMVAISAFGVTQHSQIFSLFFRNRIQCIALYQLHNSQALLNLRRGYYSYVHFTLMSLCVFSCSEMFRSLLICHTGGIQRLQETKSICRIKHSAFSSYKLLSTNKHFIPINK